MFLLDKIFLGGKFWGADRKNRRENRTTHTTKFVVHFLLPYRIGLRFVPHCCIRQASRLLLELRKREIQRASGQRALWVSRQCSVSPTCVSVGRWCMRSSAACRHRETSRSASRWRCVRAQCAYRPRACGS